MKKKLALLLAAISVLTLLAACTRYCHVDGCKNSVYDSFYCVQHGCKVKDCKEKAVALGYCEKHYTEVTGEVPEITEAPETAAPSQAPSEEPSAEPSEAPSEKPSEAPAEPPFDIVGVWHYSMTRNHPDKGDYVDEIRINDRGLDTVEFFADGTYRYYDSTGQAPSEEGPYVWSPITLEGVLSEYPGHIHGGGDGSNWFYFENENTIVLYNSWPDVFTRG